MTVMIGCVLGLAGLGVAHALKTSTAHPVVVNVASSSTVVSAEGDPLVVHEWGTFTSIAGATGVSLEWRPLEAELADLPSFVYSATVGSSCSSGNGPLVPCKGSIRAHIRMETPVIYFYSKRERTVSVHIDFPKGTITDWFPRAFGTTGESIDWPQVSIVPGSTAAFPIEPGDSHYYPARETDAAPIRVTGRDGSVEHERFLFYRGVTMAQQPVEVRLDGRRLRITGSSIDVAIVFERQGDRMSYQVVRRAGDSLEADRPTGNHTMSALERDLKKILLETDLYEKEVDSMINTWRDSWFEDGLRVFYVLSTAEVDRMLPLRIEPQPDTLVRTLVGRVEVLTPELHSSVQAAVNALDCEAPGELVMLRDSLRRKHGRFARTMLEQQFRLSPSSPTMHVKLRALLSGAHTCSLGG